MYVQKTTESSTQRIERTHGACHKEIGGDFPWTKKRLDALQRLLFVGEQLPHKDTKSLFFAFNVSDA